ncbi:uncharacterized protein LOC126833831 isoform X3 [Adelges cooleyi]|uniref:uncharacterized protein LOC126833831 isoform X3 n=1 Tax=Adelges cooleyi TaxID=133065 RepID=UPI00217F81DF|nr:uncharacterized protein LOC126833831 isoform X3 [Adelges cooleyi]
MSANICFIAAVLAATAFTLASSCEVCRTRADVDVLVFFQGYQQDVLETFFQKCDWSDKEQVYTVYQRYVQDGETVLPDFRTALYGHYEKCPETIEVDTKTIVDISATIEPKECQVCQDTGVVRCPKTKYDIFGFFETCYSEIPVQKYFEENHVDVSIVDSYKAWKADRQCELKENDYRKALYTWYKANPDALNRDCANFLNYCLSTKCPNNGGNPPALGNPPVIIPKRLLQVKSLPATLTY